MALDAPGERTASRSRPLVPALVTSLRPRQWLKNVLVVGAPLAAGRLIELPVLRATGLAFLALCLASSSVYLINDVHDAGEDRGHPRKRYRPVAAGELAPPTALAAAAVLAVAALALAWLNSLTFVALVGVYLAVSLAYTFHLRREPVIEMVAVALGFLLRGAAGGAAAGIPVSSWFLLVAGFGSLFLVSGKRYSELTAAEPRDGGRVALAAYSLGYLRFIWASAATLTVITYALWANQVYLVRDEGSWALWSLLPFLLALLRYALDIDRGTAEAPEDVLLMDRTLQVLGLIWAVMVAVGAGGMDAGV
jgi:decaprenyl-phosphate phosphoribosyltransferase